MKNFSIIVAATSSSNGIGRKGDLPWRLAKDVKHFRSITSTSIVSGKKNAVIMGRKTYEGIPEKFRPLSDRYNIIISRNPNLRNELSLPSSVLVVHSLISALSILSTNDMDKSIDQVFVIGGGSIYKEAIESSFCTKIYFTSIENDFNDLDTFFPIIPANKFRLSSRSSLIDGENRIKFRFEEYCSIPINETIMSSTMNISPKSESNLEELQYLNICKDIIENGVLRGDRTGTGTLSIFGVQMRFNLRNDIFPLLTTKRVFWRGVAEELLWFVKGSTNGKELSDKGIHIWDGNGSREFLDSRGLSHREEMDLGPVYGFQWRHFGAEYDTMHSDYNGKGIDQLKDCIQKIKNTPNDRRIILTAWNPVDLDKMALPPCHMFCQFYVANDELSCQMYQRSADMGLGVPFNIASYSLLTVMMAQVCGLKPGEFIHTIGDCHIYTNHVDALKTQIERTPRSFPTIKINPDVKDIDGFQFCDFIIENYKPDATIKMQMAV